VVGEGGIRPVILIRVAFQKIGQKKGVMNGERKTIIFMLAELSRESGVAIRRGRGGPIIKRGRNHHMAIDSRKKFKTRRGCGADPAKGSKKGSTSARASTSLF